MRRYFSLFILTCLLVAAGGMTAHATGGKGWFSFWNTGPKAAPGDKPSIYNKVVPEKRTNETKAFHAPSPAEQWAIANELRAPQMEQLAKIRAATRSRLARLDEQNRMNAIEAQAKGRKAFDEQKRREAQQKRAEENVEDQQSEAPRLYLTPEDAGKSVEVFQGYK